MMLTSQKLPPFRQRAFTLLEVLASAGVASVIGLALISLSQANLTLFSKNFSLNESHIRSRAAAERVEWMVHQAVDPPALIDKNGADVPGEGPAAGVRVQMYASTELYRTTVALTPTSTSFTTKALTATQPRPLIGDLIVMQYQDPSVTGATSGTIIAPITGVSGTGTLTLTFAQKLSTYFTPPTTASWSIATNQPFFLLTYGSLVSVPNGAATELRFYRKARSVAVDGASTFNGTANYKVLSELTPLPGQTDCLPFTYSDSKHRLLQVDLRSISRRYAGRGFNQVNTFESFHTATAYRSSIQRLLQP